MEIEVGDDAVDRRAYLGAREIEGGGMTRRNCFIESGLRGLDAGDVLLVRFHSHQVTQCEVALGLLARQVERCASAGNRCIGAFEGGSVTGSIDYEQEFAGSDRLVVMHG